MKNFLTALVVALTTLAFSGVSFAQAKPAVPATPAVPASMDKAADKAGDKAEAVTKGKTKGKAKKSTKKAAAKGKDMAEEKGASMEKKAK